MVPADHLEIVRVKRSTIDLNDRPMVAGISVTTEAIDFRGWRSGTCSDADTSKARQ